MNKPLAIVFLLAFLVLMLAGCSVSKFIPEGSYLLDNVKIESDNKEIKPSQMNLYVRQKSNAKWFSLVKLPMYIYGASGGFYQMDEPFLAEVGRSSRYL